MTRLVQKTRRLLRDEHFGEILLGTIFSLGGKVAAVAFGLGLNLFVARVYGAESLGVLAIIISVTTIASLFALGGADMAIMKLVPEHFTRYSPRSAWRVFRKLLGLVLAHSAVVVGVLWFAAGPLAERVFEKPYLADLLRLCAVFVAFYAVERICIEALRPLKAIKLYPVAQFLHFAVHLGLLVVVTTWGRDPYNPVYAYFATSGLLALVMLGVVATLFLRRVEPGQPSGPASYRTIYDLSLPMLMTTSMAVIIGNTDVVMLGAMRTEAEVGIYQIAVKVGMLASFVLNAINAMAAPKFSELYHAGKHDELIEVTRQSTRLIFWTTAPIIAVIILGGPWLLAIFGEEYVAGYGALVLLGMGQFINAISGSVGYYLSMTGAHKAFRNIVTVGALVNVFLNGLLIPRWGLEGAAFASMVALASWNLASVVYIRLKYGFLILYLPGLRRVLG